MAVILKTPADLEGMRIAGKLAAEVLDFIAFLKDRQSRTGGASIPMTIEEIEAFFHSFKVDMSGYKFDREEANAR